MGIKKIEKCVFCDDAGYDATYWWFEYGLENLIEESEHHCWLSSHNYLKTKLINHNTLTINSFKAAKI
jgi:hypothetical protein